jgi:hypothetical protein
VRLNAKESDIFLARCSFKGDSDRQKAFDHCRREYFCPFLENGRIYPCAMSALVRYFNRTFDRSISVNPGFNIHARLATGSRILNYLSKPVPTCAWCSCDLAPFRRTCGEPDPEDRDVSTHIGKHPEILPEHVLRRSGH